MAQNNAPDAIVTDNAVGRRLFVGTTTPAYPVTGDVWIDNTAATAGIQGATGTQGPLGPQGAQGIQGGTIGSASVNTWRKAAAGGETSLSGTDDFATTLAYTVGSEQVFINGVLLERGVDYTATTGTSITALTALVASDIAVVMSPNSFAVANAIPVSTVTAKGDLIAATATGTVTNLAVGTNGQVLTAASGQTSGLQWTTLSTAPWTSSAIAANTTLVTRTQYFVTTSSAWTLTLPASPTQGDEIRIFDASGSAATNNITVGPNGLNLHGSVQNLVMNVAYGSATLIYTGSTYGWKVA